jgi:hypothetical protein
MKFGSQWDDLRNIQKKIILWRWVAPSASSFSNSYQIREMYSFRILNSIFMCRWLLGGIKYDQTSH